MLMTYGRGGGIEWKEEEEGIGKINGEEFRGRCEGKRKVRERVG